MKSYREALLLFSMFIVTGIYGYLEKIKAQKDTFPAAVPETNTPLVEVLF